MKLYNIKQCNEKVTFLQALIMGLGSNQGLFFPVDLPKFSTFDITHLLKMNFIERSAHILSIYIGNEMSKHDITDCVTHAFNFSIPLIFLDNNIAILELFHGPTLAFKDFGSRLMAQMLIRTQDYCKKPMVILTATSGDTGAAVAHAFYGLSNIQVFILYPKGKISTLQEKLFCTLGGNIHTVSVNGDFDFCQYLVKRTFDDNKLQQILNLNSANSINISRILGQICYYFELASQYVQKNNNKALVVSVPSGNFGNLTAGLLAQCSGLPISRFIIATNSNDTVPRFLRNGCWNPLPTISTISNSMDVSCPNNWTRIEELFRRENRLISELGYESVSDEDTRDTIQNVAKLGYILDPHSAVAYRALCDQLDFKTECGVCLGTAHPAKFKILIESYLEKKLEILLPISLRERMQLPIVSYEISKNFSELRNLILELIS